MTCQYSTSPAAPYPLTQLRWCKLTSSSLTYLSFSYYQLPLDPASSLYTLQRRLITVAVAITPTAKIGTCRLTTGSLSPQRRLSTVSAFRHADERLGEYPQNHARTAPTSGGTNQQLRWSVNVSDSLTHLSIPITKQQSLRSIPRVQTQSLHQATSPLTWNAMF